MGDYTLLYIIFLILYLPVYIISAITMDRMAKNTGHADNRILAWIPLPICKKWLLCEIGEITWWSTLWVLIPYINLIYEMYLWYLVGIRYGKSKGFSAISAVFFGLPVLNLVLGAYYAFACTAPIKNESINF